MATNLRIFSVQKMTKNSDKIAIVNLNSLEINKIYNEAKKENCEIFIPEDCKVSLKFSGKGENKKLEDISDNEIILDIGNRTIQKINQKIDISNTLI